MGGWPGSIPKKPQCAYEVCKGDLTIRCWFRLVRTLDSETTIMEDDQMETWLCFGHESLVRDALKLQGVTVRRSVEGVVWVDMLMWILYG